MNKRIFVYNAKKKLCFREAAKIMANYETLGIRMEFIANNKEGSTDSILSLLKLGIIKDTRVVIIAHGNDMTASDNAIRSVIAII